MPLPIQTRFGRKLYGIRKDRGWTQEYMAQRFGIDRTYISDVERGEKSMSLVYLEVIAIGFGMTLSELLRGI